MAVSMTATLALPAQIIVGQKFTCTLALIEGGGTGTNLISVQPFALNSQGTKVAPQIRFGSIANSSTIGNYTGAAISINASSTMNITYEAVIDGPWMPNAPAEPNTNYVFGATIQTSDGSVFSPAPMIVNACQHGSSPGVGTRSPAPNMALAAAFAQGSTINPQYANVAAPGALAFDQGANSYWIPFL